MCRLIESLKIQNGKLLNAGYHNERMNAARSALFDCKDKLQLEEVITGENTSGVVKCRVIYDKDIRDIQYVPYAFPVIHSLKIITDNTIQYDYKYEDRKQLQSLYAQRGKADDILIIKNGRITDSYFCNVVFEKDGLYFTPSDCLLKGTKRQRLIDEGKIKERHIAVEDIKNFNRLYLINSMIDLENRIAVCIENIFW